MGLICTTPWNHHPFSAGFGINGHVTWTASQGTSMYAAANDTTTVANLLDLGMRTFRNAYSISIDASGNVTADPSARFKQFIAAAAGTGITIAPCLIPNWTGTPVAFTTEAQAYDNGFKLGRNAATNLKGIVPYYEVASEPEAVPGNKVIQTGTGRSASHYDNTKFQIFRGYIFGMIDGILSVDRVTPMVMFNCTYQHTGFADMMLNGSTPGSNGVTIPGQRKLALRPQDKVGWHWYASNNGTADDPENSQGFNVLAWIAAYGRPIYITECGANWTNYPDETTCANTIVGNLVAGRFVAVKKTYNIQQINYYQLYDSAADTSSTNEMSFGAMSTTGVAKGRYATIKSFVAANPF